jgi:hypothetical protein
LRLSANIVGEGGKAGELAIRHPPAARGPPPPFIDQGRRFTVMPHGSMCCVCQHGVQCRGIDNCPGESCLWQASWRVLCRPGAASRVVVSKFSFDRCPYANSRAWLTEGRRLYNGGRGDVLSIWVATVLGMARQFSGWQHSGGDGRTGPEVMEEMRSAGFTSRRHPMRVRGRWPYSFRGCRCPLSREATWRRYGSGRHSVLE